MLVRLPTPFRLNLPIYFSSMIGTLTAYSYQFQTLAASYVSRYANMYSFFRIPRITFGFFRFCEVTAAVEHMIYLASRLQFVNLANVIFSWTLPARSKSRRWKRKLAVFNIRLLCHAILPKEKFLNFWQTFVVMYLSHIFREGVFKKAGASAGILHWFKKMPMYWEYPYLWNFFNANLAVHYELINVLLKVEVTTKARLFFMAERDILRFLNFPVILYSLPRLWQPDPAKFILRLRVTELADSNQSQK